MNRPVDIRLYPGTTEAKISVEHGSLILNTAQLRFLCQSVLTALDCDLFNNYDGPSGHPCDLIIRFPWNMRPDGTYPEVKVAAAREESIEVAKNDKDH